MNWEKLSPYIFDGLTVLGAAVAAYYAYINRRTHELEDKASLPYYRKQLADSQWAVRYRTTLEQGLKRAELFFGRPFSWQALNMCWLIAFVYPLILFLLTWVFGGPNTLGALEMLPPDWSFVHRMAFFLALMGYYYGVYWLLKNGQRLVVWLDRFLEWAFSSTLSI